MPTAYSSPAWPTSKDCLKIKKKKNKTMKRGNCKSLVRRLSRMFRVPNKDTVLSILKLVPTDYLGAGRAQCLVQQVSSQWREEVSSGSKQHSVCLTSPSTGRLRTVHAVLLLEVGTERGCWAPLPQAHTLTQALPVSPHGLPTGLFL